MKRREFITLLGGAAARGRSRRARSSASGCGASACSCPQPRTIRNVRPASAAFLQGLQQLGWTVGRNVRIDTRWATANADDIRRHAAELVALAPDVILAHGSSTVGPLLQATRTVPIVFAQSPSIRSAPASSTAWRGRAATPPVSCSSNTA